MGGCYSANGHHVLTSRHLLPKSKKMKQNGSISADTEVVNGINVDSLHTDQTAGEEHRNLLLSLDNGVLSLNSGNVQQRRHVVPSDSGIESIGSQQEELCKAPQNLTLCKSCQQKLQRISCGSCHKCGNIRVEGSDTIISTFLAANTYCTCGPRQLGRQSECSTHGTKGKILQTKRHSDIVGLALKSNLRKKGVWNQAKNGKRVRMSWKSDDSLNMGMSMTTCIDRAKSEASEIFGDDVSFCAPLAQFDSVDDKLDTDDVNFPDMHESKMSIYSEILDLADCICKCDFTNCSLPLDSNIDTSMPLPDTAHLGSKQPESTSRSLTASPQRTSFFTNYLDQSTKIESDKIGECEYSKSTNPSTLNSDVSDEADCQMHTFPSLSR